MPAASATGRQCGHMQPFCSQLLQLWVRTRFADLDNMVAVPIEQVFPGAQAAAAAAAPMEVDQHGPQGPPQVGHDPQGSPPASSGASSALGVLRRARDFGVRATQAEVERHVVPAVQWFFQRSLGTIGGSNAPQARCASAAAWIAGQVTRVGRFSTPFVVPLPACNSTRGLPTSLGSSRFVD